MKKISKNLAALLIISAVCILSFAACDKDTACRMRIKVVTREGNAKPWANVYTYVNNKPSNITVEGFTNSEGIFEHKFDAPAIFNVVATDTIREWVYTERINELGVTVRDSDYITVGWYSGAETIRLKDGETVEKTIVIDNYNLIH